MTRDLWVKGTLRRDWLDSNVPGSSSASTVVMRGGVAAELRVPAQKVFDPAHLIYQRRHERLLTDVFSE
jgi:hypothetical protein